MFPLPCLSLRGLMPIHVRIICQAMERRSSSQEYGASDAGGCIVGAITWFTWGYSPPSRARTTELAWMRCNHGCCHPTKASQINVYIIQLFGRNRRISDFDVLTFNGCIHLLFAIYVEAHYSFDRLELSSYAPLLLVGLVRRVILKQ